MDKGTPISIHDSHALRFEVIARWNRARVGVLHLPHARNDTPMFMPVGTQGTIKGLEPSQLRELGCRMILCNTYHMGNRPGADVVEELGGLHKFMDFDGGILTDSGGFQMVSLFDLAEFKEEGVEFISPHSGSKLLLTPEKSIEIQNQLGADICMALDDVVSSTVTGPRVEDAMHRSIRWLDRCIAAHKIPKRQSLFGIIQGGLDADLRALCLEAMIARDLPGYAIGGLSGGEAKDPFWRMVSLCTRGLPEQKPRYLMGVGYAVDLVVCSALGVDMFDCVFPTRTARFGVALVRSGSLNLRSAQCAQDFSPIEEDCGCLVCRRYTRAYLHLISREALGCQLLTVHNIAYQLRLMSDIRHSIIAGTFGDFVKDFMLQQFPMRQYPVWVVEALTDAGIELEEMATT